MLVGRKKVISWRTALTKGIIRFGVIDGCLVDHHASQYSGVESKLMQFLNELVAVLDNMDHGTQ